MPSPCPAIDENEFAAFKENLGMYYSAWRKFSILLSKGVKLCVLVSSTPPQLKAKLFLTFLSFLTFQLCELTMGKLSEVKSTYNYIYYKLILLKLRGEVYWFANLTAWICIFLSMSLYVQKVLSSDLIKANHFQL